MILFLIKTQNQEIKINTDKENCIKELKCILNIQVQIHALILNDFVSPKFVSDL